MDYVQRVQEQFGPSRFFTTGALGWGPIVMRILEAWQVVSERSQPQTAAVYEWSAMTDEGELWLMLNPPPGNPA